MIRTIMQTLTPRGRRMLYTSIALFAVSGLSSAAMILVALLAIQGTFIDAANLTALWPLLAALLIAKTIANIVADKQKHFAGFDLVSAIRERIVRHLKQLSLGYYTKERLGEISEIIHKDVDNMELVVGHLWPRMVADFIVSTVVFLGLVVLDWRLALLLVSGLPVALWWLFHGLNKAQRLEQTTGDVAADMASLFVEYVRGMPVLKAFSSSESFHRKLHNTMRKFGQTSGTAAKHRATVLAIYSLLVDLTLWILLTGGIFLVLAGAVDAITYLLFAIFAREFYKPFSNLESHWMNYILVCDSFMRITRVTDAPTVREPQNPKLPQTFDIEFEHVGVAYEDCGFTLNNANFRIPERSLTALVGRSGSGKTTITNLLLRFWDVDHGSIRIGGVDIRDMQYRDLLGSISIVMQNVQLFADTIAGNIRIGKADATDAEVIAAAKRARIHDYIEQLPQGYNTVIGENGVGLSGGQRQRLSIARAFLKDAPILILDEITANIDPLNEALVQEAISELARERTVLVITHNLATIRSADQILVLSHGQIVERGTHENLLANPHSHYSQLWELSRG